MKFVKSPRNDIMATFKWFRWSAYAGPFCVVLTLCSSGAFGQSAEKDSPTVEKEIRDATTYLRSAPTKASLWHTRGQARLKLNDPVGALADFSEAIRLAPFEAEFRLSRARLYASQAQWP